MPLETGTRFGSFEIVAPLGQGGMGEVYRARDLKLQREVAIKVLPALFAGDPERLSRFTREAQLLASLNHPNIANIHGFEETAPLGAEGVGSAGALVMELVEGPTLADRIATGPIPLDETLPIARQIVAALDAAHAQGIVHRDLKPANIKVRNDGAVKVLDFGLAKLATPEPPGTNTTIANSPTFTRPSTELGMIVGTAAYMAPEQAKGRSVDKRADIWAFGLVLFEMLTGKQVFDGEDASEILAGVLKEEPNWSVLPGGTPAAIRRLLHRCLEKDPKRRLHDIADALPDLEDAASGAPESVVVGSPRRSTRQIAIAAIVGAAVTALVFAVVVSMVRPSPTPPMASLSVLPPPAQPFLQDAADAAISPDGRYVVFAAGASQAAAELWLRPIDSTTARALSGTKGGFQPFWSPDATRIGFFADGKLKTTPIDGGTATVLADAPDPRGGTWSTAGQIVFAPSNGGGLMKISAEGGDPSAATNPDASRGETGHRFPCFLPDGRHFLFVALPGRNGRLDVVAGTLDGSDRKALATAQSGAAYAPPGYLIFGRQNGAVAQRFDASRLTLDGEPITLSELPHDVFSQWTGAPPVSASNTGAIVYYSAAINNSRFVWFDVKSGTEQATLSAPEGFYQHVSIAPNGRVAAVVRQNSTSESDIWLLDLERGGASRFTNGPGRNEGPSWSPDGRQIAFVSDRNNQSQIFVKPVNGSEPERQISTDSLAFKATGPWTKDGASIVFTALDPKTQRDIWILPVLQDHTPKPYLRTPFIENGPSLSPDGRWLEYWSDETGQAEIYVQSFPTPGDKYRVTTGGASFGGFLPDGRIVYSVPGNLTASAVPVTPGPPFRTGAPQPFGTLPPDMISADVTPDLSRLLAVVPADRKPVISLTVVLNWSRMLTRNESAR